MKFVTKNNRLYKGALNLVILMLLSVLALAQQSPPEVREDFTDDELKSFAEAYNEVMAAQQESERKMLSAIEGENLSLERFNEMLAMQQNPEMEMNASAEEMASFNKAAQAIIKERQENENRLVSIIEKKGLDIDTYEEIIISYQHSPKVQKKLDKLLDETIEE